MNNNQTQTPVTPDVAYYFPRGLDAAFICDHAFRDLCAEAGIAIDENDPHCEYLSEFCEHYNYATVVAARQIGGADGWLCIR